jgi:hypothetical protein
MKKLIKYSLLALGLVLAVSTSAHAQGPECGRGPQGPQPVNSAPEVDPSLAVSAMALLGGSLTVVRARRRKQ